MYATILKRKLKDAEIELLVEEIKKFPNPVAGNKKRWQILNPVYIAMTKNELAGICGVIKLKNWIKLGPFVVLKKYHGKGYGKTIINHIVKDYSKDNLFVGSRNPAVWKIATNLGFKEVSGIWILPNEVKLYLIKNLIQSLSIDYLREFIRKMPAQEGKYRCFIRSSDN